MSRMSFFSLDVEKVLLIVDMEQLYLNSGMHYEHLSAEDKIDAQTNLFRRCLEISSKIEKYKNLGYAIHFTGYGSPLFLIDQLVDVKLPYWSNNLEFISKFYKNHKNVLVGGLFKERCVYSVSRLVNGSEVVDELCASHDIVGGVKDSNIDYEYVTNFLKYSK